MKLVTRGHVTQQPCVTHGVLHVAIYSDDDEILAVMWDREDGTTALVRAGEPEFESMVAQMNLSKRSDISQVMLSPSGSR